MKNKILKVRRLPAMLLLVISICVLTRNGESGTGQLSPNNGNIQNPPPSISNPATSPVKRTFAVPQPIPKLPRYDIYLFEAFFYNYGSNAAKINYYSISAGSIFMPAKHAVVWYEPRHPTDLGTLGGLNSLANAINDKNDVVGSSQYRPDLIGYHAFLKKNSDEPMIDLGTLGGPESDATAVNNNQQVVGWSYISYENNTFHAFLWEQGQLRELVRLPGGTHSYANDINDAGLAVGCSTENGGIYQYPVLWKDRNTVTKLPTIESCTERGCADAINDQKIVAGQCGMPSGKYRAIYWDAFGRAKDIGTINNDDNWANDINNAGEIVGQEGIGSDGKAFVYLPHYGIIDLNNVIPANSGWLLQTAQGINDSGVIVGWGKYKGVGHGFMLVPRR